MSSDPSHPSGYSPDDVLPPVEPPSAGFIVQLFVVPGVIVVVVVLIWLMFNWLAQKGSDRDALVRDLSRNNAARWQAAFTLAQDLKAERNAKNPTLTTDPELAKKLAQILHDEIKAGSLEENPITLRIYLSRALGEFRVPDGLPTLIEAATTVRDEKENEVRRAALEGIALLADNAGSSNAEFASNPQLEEVLLAAAGDTDVRTRNVAAVGLGIIGTPPMVEKLHFMLGDAYPDVRYNAAVRLAQRGDEAAVPVLVEMLDQQEQAGIKVEKEAMMQDFKRALITINALRASGQLAEKNSSAELAPLQTAIDKLLAGKVTPETRIEATSALHHFAKRGAAKTP
jgi:HEAT repeat protein